MIQMTREKAVEITRVLNDIEDFEMFMEQIDQVYHNTEGNLSGFYHDQLLPLMRAELKRREDELQYL